MLSITFWGTRGSVPVSGAGYARHGGSTTCIEIVPHEPSAGTPARIIIDCGTGLAGLGRARGFGCSDALLLQTHVHWDHIQGFPFFGSLFNPKARFESWAVPRDGVNFRDVLSQQMSRPIFPVGLDILPSKLDFHELALDGHREAGEITVRWTDLCHPSGSTGFRVDYRGASFVFSGDVEVQLGSAEALIELARGADVLVMDAQYTREEYPSRRGFGHSTPEDAVDVAKAAGVRRLYMTHHDPAHDDSRLDAKLDIARQYADAALEVFNAYDQLTIDIKAEVADALEEATSV